MSDIYNDKIFKKHGNSFCAMPWSSFWIYHDGKVAPCCKYKGSIGDTNRSSLKELENSPKLVELRKQFLNGERPKECIACWRRETGGISGDQPRSYGNKCAESTIEKALEDTNPDGTVNKFHPTWLDMLWTNKCNFSCNICNPSTSSSIVKDREEFNVLHNRNYKTDVSEKNNYKESIKYILDNANTLKHLHFGGGEPFMQQDTFKLLDLLLENGLDSKIGLHFHTNGSITNTYKGINIVDRYLKDWKSTVHISMSHDHFGERGKYCRYGYNETKWLTNYNRFKEVGIPVKVQTTLSVYNITSLELLSEWYVKNLDKDLHIVFGLCQDPKSLCFEQFNIHNICQKQVIDSIDKSIEIFSQNNNYREVNELKNRKETFLNSKAFKEHFKSFVEGTKLLDIKRNTNLLKVMPELENFYKLCDSDTI